MTLSCGDRLASVRGAALGALPRRPVALPLPPRRENGSSALVLDRCARSAPDRRVHGPDARFPNQCRCVACVLSRCRDGCSRPEL